jgi:predicted transcriptional regulator
MCISGLSYAQTTNAEKNNNVLSEKTLRRFLKYPMEDPKVPSYRKTFDEYIVDLEYIQRFNKIPRNLNKDNDLAKMNYNGPITLR